MRLGYLGPAGTFTHAALVASRHAQGAEAIPLATEREAILAAESGAVAAALVPIENALEGGVNATLDTLALDAPGARIVGEEVLPISHALIARPGVAEADIEVVVSHPQALGQCRRFLAGELPGRRAVAATATAEAVRTVAETAAPWAAIGPAAAAALHGCVILRQGIEDEHGNETRFIWVAGPTLADGAFGDEAPAGWKSSIVFHGSGDTTPGWLVGCLSEFASRGINLVRIESRPLKRGLGHYQFLVDFEGRAEEGPGAEVVAGLHALCEQVRLLGSYPAAS